MTFEILLAPVGAGKTETVQARIEDVKAENRLASIWVLLATERQIIDFRRRLMARPNGARLGFNIEFFNFYTLYARLLMLAGEPQRKLSDSARYGVIRAVLRDLQAANQLPIFGGVADTGGLIRIAADFIYELKQGLIDPETFANAAAQSNDAKLTELALVYAAYQRVLVDHKLVDREGEGWVALSALAKNPTLAASVDLLVVDGYDQFNPLQARLLTHLGGRVKGSVLTLTTVPGREDTIGRRFDRALNRIERAHEEENYPFKRTFLTAQTVTQAVNQAVYQAPPLRMLSDRLFMPNAEAIPDAADVLTLIEAPDPVQEVAAILRHVKRLLLNGVPPDAILIAVRDWSTYGAHFAAFGRSYGIPLSLHQGEPLIDNPAIMALIGLLELHTNKFRRRDLLDGLRSPYFTFDGFTDSAHIDRLDTISRDYLVLRDADEWLDAVSRLAVARDETEPDDDSTNDERRDDRIKLPAGEADALRDALAQIFQQVTPPTTATALHDYIGWIESLIGDDSEPDVEDAPDDPLSDDVLPDDDSIELIELITPFPLVERGMGGKVSLHLLKNIRTPLHIGGAAMNGIVERDISAVKALKVVMRGMIAAEGLLHSIGSRAPGEPLSWDEFWSALKTALQARTIRGSGAGGRDGCVLVTIVADARGLPHPHVFVPGLSEGIFPAPVAEDRLLLDSERRDLRDYGLVLTTNSERADEDGLFFELLNLAGESFTLSRPTVKDGAKRPHSHLWWAATRITPDAARLTLAPGSVIAPEGAAALHEVALAVAHQLSDENAAPSVGWIAGQGDSWARIARGRWIELTRLAHDHAHDRFTGRLTSPDAVAIAAAKLAPDHVWSASQLNEYGVCPFQFFAKRMLKLEKIKDPDEGMDARQLGTLYHELLELTYRRIAVQRLTITPENTVAGLEILREVMDVRLPSAPFRLRVRPSALWTQEQLGLRRRLEAFVNADFAGKLIRGKDWDAADARIPYQMEAAFGDADQPIMLHIGGEKLRIRGKIDRIDRVGDRVVVMDYKTGAHISTDEVTEGRNFQMMLYLKAAEGILARDFAPDKPTTVHGGLFVHLRSRDASGKLILSDPEAIAIIEVGETHIAENIAQGRAGDFSVQANQMTDGKCAHHCDYHQFCRAPVTNQHKRNAPTS